MRQESSQILSIELAVALAAQDKKMEAMSLFPIIPLWPRFIL